jgi:hypothetical protein
LEVVQRRRTLQHRVERGKLLVEPRQQLSARLGHRRAIWWFEFSSDDPYGQWINIASSHMSAQAGSLDQSRSTSCERIKCQLAGKRAR